MALSGNFSDLILRDVEANRPAPGIPGRLFFNLTTHLWQRDTGSVWEDCEAAQFGGDATAIHTDGVDEFTGLTEKTSPVATDLLLIEDWGMESSYPNHPKKKVQVGNLANALALDGLAPTGGMTGQVLAKVSGADFAYAWATPAAGGGGGNPLLLGELMPPPSSGWTWLNQGSATFTDHSTYQYLYGPAGSGGTNTRAVLRPMATGNRLSVMLKPLMSPLPYQGLGMLVRNSANGRLMQFAVYLPGGNLNADRFGNEFGNWNGGIGAHSLSDWAIAMPFYWGFKLDATNIYFQLSLIGDNTEANWQTIFTIALADYIGAIDQVGPFIYSEGSLSTASLALMHWNLYS